MEKSNSWQQSGNLLYRLSGPEARQQNHDEVRVTMAQGSRDEKPCTEFTEKILRFLRSTDSSDQPQVEVSTPQVQAAVLALVEVIYFKDSNPDKLVDIVRMLDPEIGQRLKAAIGPIRSSEELSRIYHFVERRFLDARGSQTSS